MAHALLCMLALPVLPCPAREQKREASRSHRDQTVPEGAGFSLRVLTVLVDSPLWLPGFLGYQRDLESWLFFEGDLAGMSPGGKRQGCSIDRLAHFPRVKGVVP